MKAPPLSGLPRLLADDPGVVAVASGSHEVVAVSEAARPLFAAGLHRLTGARPLLLAVPTAAEAERIAGDLVPDARRGHRWSCSPPGRRCRSSASRRRWRRWVAGCGSCGGCARAGRARPRSWWRRCARSCSGSVPTSRTSSRSSSARATQIDRDDLLGAPRRRGVPARVPGRGARRDRGARLDRRHLPGHRRPPGARRPVGRRDRPALDVLGRGPAQQRGARRGPRLPVPRAAPDRRGAGARPRSCCRRRRGASAQWERLTEGQCSTAWSRGCRG